MSGSSTRVLMNCIHVLLGPFLVRPLLSFRDVVACLFFEVLGISRAPTHSRPLTVRYRRRAKREKLKTF